MNELEGLKARADEDFKRWQEGRESELSLYEKTKASLDRAIAIAEERTAAWIHDTERHVATMAAYDEVIAAVKALRERLNIYHVGCSVCSAGLADCYTARVLADTAWLDDR